MVEKSGEPCKGTMKQAKRVETDCCVYFSQLYETMQSEG